MSDHHSDPTPSRTQPLRDGATRQAMQWGMQQLAARGAAAAASSAGAPIWLLAALGVALLSLLLICTLALGLTSLTAQTSMAPWPIPVATYQAGVGVQVSSRFGWRTNPFGTGLAFHDGIDLANAGGGCPLGWHCPVPAMFDGRVVYVGWDQPSARDPQLTGGGQIVILRNGQGDHQTLYAHLEPYRLYVQLQGRIHDPYGRYDGQAAYQPIGAGALTPALRDGQIAISCADPMPRFVPIWRDGGTITFAYDRAARCETRVQWAARGDGWQGWTADDGTVRTWQTPIRSPQTLPFFPDLAQRRAFDVALRFRATLIPPPPPPTRLRPQPTRLQPTCPTRTRMMSSSPPGA